MLKCYVDESGLGKNQDEIVCCVAGFFSRNAHWGKFQKHWRALLKKYGLDEFKAKDFWRRSTTGGLTGKYANWSFGDANEFMQSVIRLILDYRLHLLGSAVNLAEFFSYAEEDRRFLTGAQFDVTKSAFVTSGKPTTAYFAAFNVVVTQGAKIGARKKELMHFVFDEQNEFAPLARQRMPELRESEQLGGVREFLGDLVYSPSSRVLPLQCADLVAFACKDYYRREMSGLPIDFVERAVISPMEVLQQILLGLPVENQSLFKLGRQEFDLMLSCKVVVPE